MGNKEKKLIFEISKKGRRGVQFSPCDVPEINLDELLGNDNLRNTPPDLPEVSEIDTIRHYTQLSKMNHGVDSGFYPLGSCTMKYNPKVNEHICRFPGFVKTHPYQSIESIQGNLEILYKMDQMLSEITGMKRVTLQPAAGAHGEMTGLLIIKAYHLNNGDAKRTNIIVPDSAHGTNPASCSTAGFNVLVARSNKNGRVDIEYLKSIMDDTVAGLMLTNPNTLGLFENEISEISEIVHSKGGLLYYDGANTNAIVGKARPGDMGFDVVHLNLHKTFGTPHGSGGSGAGPVGVTEKLSPFLPTPVVECNNNGYYLDYDRELSIGRVKSFYGNFSVILKAYSYIMSLGSSGLKEVSEIAVLNANYMMNQLKKFYHLPFDDICMHEFVLSGQLQKEMGVSTMDIAKRLLDFGFHPPTVYFPLTVKESIMIEPTETESMETLDEFIDAMITIANEIKVNPEYIKTAPHTTIISRLDEVKAARDLKLKWNRNSKE